MVPSGSKAWVTGAAAGASVTSYDLDGRTSVRSPAIRLGVSPGQRLTFRYVFAHTAASSAGDRLVASVEDVTGHRTPVKVVLGKAVDVDGAWTNASIGLDAWSGQTIRIHFLAVDGDAGNLVEVEIDDVRVTRPS
jgi:hypothetical protein